MEIWKDVKGYEGLYQVSDKGRVKRNGKVLKRRLDKDGYDNVIFCKNGKIKAFKVHRLVAEAFVPNPDNKPEVDHINTISDDNRAENLRWCSALENANNPITQIHRGKFIYCIDEDNVKTLYSSIAEVVKQRKISRTVIRKSLMGKIIFNGKMRFELC